MAKVFLDTNYFIGLANRTPETDVNTVRNNDCFISPLSCHILFYVNKEQVPNEKLNSYIEDFNLVEFSKVILEKALYHPTNDLEENIQLYSALEANCEYFLTADKKLLKMKYFGPIQIVSSLQ